jgi:hypothetical protein
MRIEILVCGEGDVVLHHRVGTIKATTNRGLRATHTRLLKRLQRIYPDWRRISIDTVPPNKLPETNN